MPIERDPSDRNLPFWRVTITDSGGKQVFKDDSKLIGTLSVYWIWDNEDRIWLWNSDDGTTYYWQFDETSWSRRQHRGGTLKPPEALYPEYLKRM